MCVSISFTYSLHWQLSLNPVHFLLSCFHTSSRSLTLTLFFSFICSPLGCNLLAVPAFPLKPLSRMIFRVCPLYLPVPFVPLPSFFAGEMEGCLARMLPLSCARNRSDRHTCGLQKGMPSINLNSSRPTPPTGKKNHKCDLFNSSIVSPRSVVLRLFHLKAPVVQHNIQRFPKISYFQDFCCNYDKAVCF